MLRQDHVKDQARDEYERNLEAMSRIGLYCRAQGRRFNHLAKRHTKEERRRDRDGLHGTWLGNYITIRTNQYSVDPYEHSVNNDLLLSSHL